MKKIIGILLAVVILGISVKTEALACTQTPDCYATGETVVCGTQYATTTTHIVSYPNGYTGTCSVDTIKATHYIYCSGCDALLRTEVRTCKVLHSDSHCYDENGLCQ